MANQQRASNHRKQPTRTPFLKKKMIQAGSLYFSQTPANIMTVVSSGIAVTVWDSALKHGGMAHFIRPGWTKGLSVSEGFRSISELLKMLKNNGSTRRSLRASIYGGADYTMGTSQLSLLAKKNVKNARQVLKKFNIPIVSEDIGGGMGRKLIYNSGTDEMMTAKVNTIRKNDWHLPS